MLAPTEYTKRHNKLAGYIQWMICKNFQIETNPRYYEHQPQNNVSTTKLDLLWDKSLITDRTIPANRPDIIVKNKQERICQIIEISIPDDQNVIQKEEEKSNKYKDFQIEI